MIIRESNDLDESTEDDFELDQTNVVDVEQHSRTIFASNNDVDRRLVSAYQVKRWKDDYKRHKGKTAPFKAIQAEKDSLHNGQDLEAQSSAARGLIPREENDISSIRAKEDK